MQTIKIENFRGIQDLTIEPNGKPVVVFGYNGAGKTSVCEAIRVALAGQKLSSVAATHSTHCGLASGYKVSVQFNEQEWAIVATPAGVVRGDGDVTDPIAVGLTKLSGLKRKERLTSALTITGESTLDNLDNYFASVPDGDAAKAIIRDALKEDDSDGTIVNWEKHSKRFEENYRSDKRQFMKLTGENFGSVKAANWRPADLPITEQRTMKDLLLAWNVADDAYKTSDAAKQKLQADWQVKFDLWQTIGDKIEKQVEALNQVSQHFETEGAGINEEHGWQNIPIIINDWTQQVQRLKRIKERKLYLCKACDTQVIMSPHVPGELIIPDGKDEHPTIDQDLKLAEKMLGHANEAQAILSRIGQLRKDEKQANDTVEAAIKKLDAFGIAKEYEGESIEQLDKLIAAAKKLHEVQEVVKECHLWKTLIDACAPDGIGQIAVTKACGAINTALEEYCKILHLNGQLGMKICLLEDGNVTIKRRNYETLIEHASKSEQWLADLCYQLYVGDETNPDAIVVDEADILDGAQLEDTMRALLQNNLMIIALSDTGGFDMNELSEFATLVRLTDSAA